MLLYSVSVHSLPPCFQILKVVLANFCFNFIQNSVNGRESRIPYPWLVFNEKIKVNSIFLRDSTAVSDSVLLLFGGSVLKGDMVSSFI